jgi:hypothetical protein
VPTLQLLLVKRLFIEAGEYVDRGDSVSCGIAISMLQDAAELYVWTLVKERSLVTKEQSGFVQNLELLQREGIATPHSAKLLELNKARVGFKHYGNLPAPEEAKKHQGYVESFLRLAMSEHFGVSFDELMLLDLVKDVEIKGYLLAANEHLKADALMECAFELAKARATVLDKFAKYIPSVDRNLARADHPEHRRGEPFAYLAKYLSELRQATLIALLKLPFEDYMALETALPSVSRSETGQWWGNHRRSNYTEAECSRAMAFIVNLAVRLESTP